MRNIYIALVLIVLGASIYLIGINRGPISSEPTFCTMEALLCPDGSGVGRTGPQCEFSACPNQESFTGELSQQGGEFFLIMGAPEDTIEEVTYSMPLKIERVSNALGTLVGKQVRVKGAFSTGNTLEVDIIEAIEDGTLGELRVGETKFVNGVRITLHRIVEDSRCPIDAVCIQMGRLVADVTLKSDTDEERINIESTQSALSFDTFKVSIDRVQPSPLASTTIKPADYRIVFKVEK